MRGTVQLSNSGSSVFSVNHFSSWNRPPYLRQVDDHPLHATPPGSPSAGMVGRRLLGHLVVAVDDHVLEEIARRRREMAVEQADILVRLQLLGEECRKIVRFDDLARRPVDGVVDDIELADSTTPNRP